ncbi:hypothetical protein CEXT_195871 [Caerostris extrusa]|uniref:Uncharacterized protein n=1 Tax=Caerostris extrusa TaxID=172846 RepID=A0AAV4XB20_CAEEX|nr:hypothetical protein CEXT_195871 [Caerostris extrusa]
MWCSECEVMWCSDCEVMWFVTMKYDSAGNLGSMCRVSSIRIHGALFKRSSRVPQGLLYWAYAGRKHGFAIFYTRTFALHMNLYQCFPSQKKKF